MNNAGRQTVCTCKIAPITRRARSEPAARPLCFVLTVIVALVIDGLWDILHTSAFCFIVQHQIVLVIVIEIAARTHFDGHCWSITRDEVTFHVYRATSCRALLQSHWLKVCGHDSPLACITFSDLMSDLHLHENGRPWLADL